MNASRFIAGKLRFKGQIAMVSVAVSFFVMILAVAVSSGYRKEIRSGISSFSGDISLTPASWSYEGEGGSISARPSYYASLEQVEGVRSITPVVTRAGIVKQGETIHGVIFKGVAGEEMETLHARVPSKLAQILSVSEGDKLLSYFIGEKVKARNFEIESIYENPLSIDEALIIYVPIGDLQRVSEWEEDRVSALEVRLTDRFQSPRQMEYKASELGAIAAASLSDEDDVLLARSIVESYPQLFDWLGLIDYNVLIILILMSIVAGFNMISGLLILLFRSMSTIGVLKSMGMTDRGIAAVFLRVSSNLVLKGMLIGNALALLFCWVQGATHLLKLDPDNYFVSFVPTSVNLPLILAADLAAYVVIMLLLLIPTLFIAKVDPAQTVRAQ